MDDLKNKRITVAGLGRFGGGIAAARWLVGEGARVLVTDIYPADKLADSIAQLHGLPIEYRLGEHRTADFTDTDLIVASPAIKPTNPYLQAARAAGVPITTEIRLFVQRCPLPIVAVSGTKGKSTTSKLLELMLATRHRVWLGGNIGKSLLFDLPTMRDGQIVLLEVSSFMLEYLGETHWAPHVGLLTMLESDHLEWHITQEAYLNAKLNLIRYQSAGDFAVLGESCPTARDFAGKTPAKVIWYGVPGRPRFKLMLPGEHNQLNVQAAFAAASLLGVDFDQAQKAVADFPGLAHRLQLVHQSEGVRFVDDSIATIPMAAAAALRAFPPGKVIQIVGGHDKGLPYEPMCDAIAHQAKAALCIGEMANAIAKLTRDRHPNYPAVYECGDIATAMRQAKQLATSGDIVLLATGCSSYDQFINFEQRGQAFANAARAEFTE